MRARLGKDIPTWTELNLQLRLTHNESAVAELLDQLRETGANARWLRRTNARLRKLRNQRERREFEKGLKPRKGPRR